jgi:hypothetical protein
MQPAISLPLPEVETDLERIERMGGKQQTLRDTRFQALCTLCVSVADHQDLQGYYSPGCFLPR